MPTDAYWAVACAGLGFCLTLAMVANNVARKALREARDAIEDAADQIRAWQSAYNSRTEQLEATRIALREAQKNDHRDALGRFSRAS